MTDQELLELAAKAAELDGKFLDDADGGSIVYWTTPQYVDQQPGPVFWRPLRDDGDALRLAVRLRMDFSVGQSAKAVCATEEHFAKEVVPAESDPYAAARRAIVRAAAEIGKQQAAQKD